MSGKSFEIRTEFRASGGFRQGTLNEMKMTLKRANWACLLAFVLIFAACKKEKEEEVVPEPIVGVTVENGDADVTIDQQEKRIDVTFYAYCDLSEVLVSFDLIEGAQMFIPYLE